jgi:hypothetical protein
MRLSSTADSGGSTSSPDPVPASTSEVPPTGLTQMSKLTRAPYR